MNGDTSSSPRPSQRPAPYAIDATSLGWVIVGASAVADQFAIRAIRSQPPLPNHNSVNSWIAGIHSHHGGRAQQFAVKHHIPHASDELTALLQREHVNCVYVANHPRHHFESVRDALLAGKHVLCEPPLALTMDEAQILTEIAERYGLLLGVNFIHRCDPTLRQLKTMLANDVIGELLGGRLLNAQLLEIRQRTWRLQADVGGVLLHRTLFDIDLLRFLFEDEIDQIQAQNNTRVHTADLDEDVQTSLHFKKNRVSLSLYDSFLVPHVDSRLELFGTNGAIIVSNCLSLQQPGELIRIERDASPTVVSLVAEQQDNQRFVNAIAAFHYALRNNDKPTASAHDFMKALQVIEVARASLKHNHWLAVAG